MNDELFSPSFGNKPQKLIGRTEEMNKLRSALASKPGSKERATLIIGQRGLGKTVLLLELYDIAHRSGFITAFPTVVNRNMLDRINEKLLQDGKDVLSENKRHLVGGSIGVFGISLGVQLEESNGSKPSFEYMLEQICREAEKHGKGILILIDEIRANDEELKQLIIAYQELVGKGANIALIMAGLPSAVSETLNNPVLTFLNRASRIKLEPIRIADISAYYYQCFQKIGLKMDLTAVQRAAKETKGSPYMMQLIGHYLTLYADDTGRIDDITTELALSAAKTEYMNDICSAALHGTSVKDREFLCAMLEDPVQSRTKELAERMQVSNSHVQTYKKRLIDAGIIKQIERGIICYDVPMLREYLTEHYMSA